METLKKTVKDKYHILVDKIASTQGGWASLAYKIKDIYGNYFFLKVYEKNRKSTPYLTEHIDIYLPIVDWINNNTPLNGKIIRLVKTQNGDYKYEDERYLYILFEYIEGRTVGEQNLTEEQVLKLAGIVSELHNIKRNIPFDTCKISETFYQPFIHTLTKWLDTNPGFLKKDIKKIVEPHHSLIEKQIKRIKHLATGLKEKKLKYCLCHTDIHHWNIIVNDDQLYLLDWEGIKFAPPEADIFTLFQQSYFDIFIQKYKEKNPGYQLNNTALQYYTISRKLQDIYEFIEQLQFDQLNPVENKTNLNYLQKEINSINIL